MSGDLDEADVDARGSLPEDGSEPGRRALDADRARGRHASRQEAVGASTGGRRVRPARDHDAVRGRDVDGTGAGRPERVPDDVPEDPGPERRDAEAGRNRTVGGGAGRVERERDVGRGERVRVEEDDVGREERPEEPGVPCDGREEPRDRALRKGGPRRLGLDGHRPARDPASGEPGIVLEAKGPRPRGGGAGERRERVDALDGPADHLAKDRAGPARVLDQANRDPVRIREGSPEAGQAGMLDGEGDGEGRDAPDESRNLGAADRRGGTGAVGVDPLAGTSERRGGEERCADVDARRRPRRSVRPRRGRRSGGGSRRRGAGSPRGCDLPGEEEGSGGRRRRGRRPREARSAASARRRDHPPDAGSEGESAVPELLAQGTTSGPVTASRALARRRPRWSGPGRRSRPFRR